MNWIQKDIQTDFNEVEDFYIKDIEKVGGFVIQCIKKNKKILLYTDY